MALSPIVIVAIVIGVLIVIGVIIGVVVYFLRKKKTPPATPGSVITLVPASSLTYTDLISLENAIMQQITKLQKTAPPPNPFPITYVAPIQSYIDTLKASIISASTGTTAQQAEYNNNKLALITTVAYLTNIAQQITARNSQTLPSGMSAYDTQIQATINDLITKVNAPL